MRRLVAALALLIASTVLASPPGHPLDISDWVVAVPGLTASTYVARGTCAAVYGPVPAGCSGGGALVHEGNDGSHYILDVQPVDLPCDVEGAGRLGVVVYRATATGQEELARIVARCVSPTRSDYVTGGGMTFSAVDGSLKIWLHSGCVSSDDSCPPDYDGDGTVDTEDSVRTGGWIAELRGLPTLFDELQSFAPHDTLGFRVPVMPEGFRTADRFDTYTGEITRPLDLSGARALQCGYPTSTPHAGDFEQITAPVPAPAPGHATYVLTTVTSEGRTRAGRKTNAAGRLVARDASALPACVLADGKSGR